MNYGTVLYELFLHSHPQIEKQGSMAGVNVQQLLMDMRQQRMGLIQTHEQLKFSYEAIIEGAKRILSGTDLGYCDPSEVMMETE